MLSKGDLVDGCGLPEDGVVAILADHEFVGHAAGGREAPVDGEVARAAQGVDEAGSAGEDRLAGVDDVAEAIVAAPGDAAVDGVLAVENLIDFDGLIVLAFGGLGAEDVAGGVESVAGRVGEVVGQGLVLDFRLNGGVEAEALGIVLRDVVGADVEAGQGIAGGIDGSSGGSGGLIAAAFDVAQEAGAGGGGVDEAVGGAAGAGAQGLHLAEEEGLVLDDGSGDAAAVDILLELGLAEIVEVVLPLVGVEARGAIEPEAVAVEIVGAGAGDHGDLAAGVAAVLGGVVAGENAHFVEHVGVDAEGGGVAAALAGIVDVDAVEGVVPGAVACAVDVDAAAGGRAGDDAGLGDDEIERIASARADDGQVFDGGAGDEIAVVAGVGGLHGFGSGLHFHGVDERADFELDVDGGGLADVDQVVAGAEFAKALGFDVELVGAGLHGLEGVGAGGGGAGFEGEACAFVDQLYRRLGHDGPGGILHGPENAGGGALAKRRGAGAHE